MDENGGNGCTSGCGTTRNNKLYRSTDGGATWTNTYTGPSFVGPCRSNSGFFCTMYSSPAYWRHMGWGEPAAFNHVVSLVYAEKDGADPGNVYYIRSTDSGVTFSAPFQLNSNTDPTKAQWQPNLSVSEAGTLMDGEQAKARVDSDVARAESLEIKVTPTLYINGQPVDPKDKNPEGVRAAINAVLAGKPHAWTSRLPFHPRDRNGSALSF